MTFYKAIRPDGTDFYTGAVQWAPESGDIPADGIIVTYPTSTVWEESHSTHLCASTSPTDCTGFEWPCRLLEVEPVGEVYRHAGSKRSALSWRVVRELPAPTALGPQGEAVVALVDRLERLGATQQIELLAERFDAQDSAWEAARGDAWYAVRGATRGAAWIAALGAAGIAASTLVAWDLITTDQRDILTAHIRTALPNLWADVTALLPEGVTHE